MQLGDLRDGMLVWYDVPGKGRHPAIVLYVFADAPPVVLATGTSISRGGLCFSVKAGDRSILGSALSNDTKFHYGDFVRVDITSLSPWSCMLCVEPPVLARLRAALADHPPK